MNRPAAVGSIIGRTWPEFSTDATAHRERPDASGACHDAAPSPSVPPAITVASPSIPKRFATASFDSFEADAQPLQAALAAVQRFVRAAADGRPAMLALVGSQGTGKSHLLYSAVHALIAQNNKVYSRPWYQLADELRYGGRSPFNENAKLEPAEVRELLWKQRIIMLDEVRPTSGTAFDDTELAKFSCHAYDQELAVLITTNVNPLADVMGPAAASRYSPLVVEGRDRRRATSAQAPASSLPTRPARPARTTGYKVAS